MKHVTIRQALQNVADNPVLGTDVLLEVKAHELICRNLFEIANRAEAANKGSMTRANKARKMILDRLVGRRRPGSHPATRQTVTLDFVDLTKGALDA